MPLAVAVARIRFDANEIVAGQLGFDAFEVRRLCGRYREQRPARRAGKQLEALAACLAITDRIDRRAALRHVEHLVVQPQRVQTCSRFRGQPPELDNHRLVAQHEAFGDEDQRFRGVDHPQPDQQIAQSLDGPVGFAAGVARQRQRLGHHLRSAQLDLRHRRAHQRWDAFAALHRIERPAIAVLDSQRFGQGDAVRRNSGASGFLLPGHPADCLLDAGAIRGKRRRRRARPEARHGDAIGRHQSIDERVGGAGDAHRPAEPDVRLVDGDDDQPSRGRVFVRGEALRRRRGRRRSGRRGDQRYPFGADDAPRRAVDADREISRREGGNRMPAVVDHPDVQRGHVDRGLKSRLRR